MNPYWVVKASAQIRG